MPRKLTNQKAIGIDPRMRYTLLGFKQAAGVGDKLILAAAKKGVSLRKKRIGKRVYIDGEDAIRYLDELEKLPKPICG
ncbi:hypothetical protein [Aeoliella mucimassa]|uniref:Uncharacterized protein n=1 Tax=Aeoliella mucimassa TaxID=2527972 RepID=A0A518AT78_9BACT|nr:hypothetical protein [Aeoliella mucimassa]QDU57922.1 hypothetical protein Pan181_41450 [Aeoliella mucimassa]